MTNPKPKSVIRDISRTAAGLMVACLILLLLPQTTMLGSASAASKIVVVVNNVPITNNDISRRAAFLKLRRVKGNRRQLAKEELIDEAIKMQEARRIGRVAPDKQVNEAYARFAKNNKMPLKILDQIMARAGVTKRGFKNYIKAQMSWQGVVGARYRALNSSRQKSNPLAHLHGGGGGRSEDTTEYTVQQIIFVVPQNQLKTLSKARMAEANNFRSTFSGCAESITRAAKYRDVTILSKGRKQAHELPPSWQKEIADVPIGKTTRPLRTSKGVELLALCNKRQVRSSLQKKSEDDIFTQTTDPNQAAAKVDKEYFAALKKRAVIKNRN